MTKTVALVGLLATLVTPSVVHAQAAELGELNLMFGITGQMAASKDAAAKVGFQAISLGLPQSATPDKLYWIGVVTARGWNADPFVGKDVLGQVIGYSPSLIVSAKPALLEKIQQAVPGSRISVEGILNTESRTYLVGTVQVTPPGTK